MKWSPSEAEWVEVYKALQPFNLLRFENLSTAAQYWIVYEKLRQTVPPGSRVLDWGCGDGHFSYFLLHSGYPTDAYNVNRSDGYHEGCALAEYLKSRYPDRFNYRQSEGDDPVRLPYEDGSFDAVVSVGVLEHVRQEGGDERKSLLEIRRILKPGGRFLCFHFPNKFSWIEAIARRIPSKHHHPFTFTAGDITRLNEEAGLALEGLGRYAVLPRNELARLPEKVKNAAWFVKSFNTLDRVLKIVFRPLVQNHYFISRKTD